MLRLVLGITYGAAVGLLGNWLLFHRMRRAKERGREPIAGLGTVFLIRLMADALALVLFWALTRDALGLVAAGISLTVAVQLSLWIVLRRKGGRLE